MFKLAIVAIQLMIIMATVVYAEPLRMTLTQSNNLEQECLAEALYFEGRNQTANGMAAVGYSILNRVRSPNFPDTICEVVHQGPLDGSPITLNRCQFSYFCDGKDDVYPVDTTLAEVKAASLAVAIAPKVMAREVKNHVSSATYYHANYVAPHWSKVYTEVARVDSHIFYIHW